MPSLLDLGKGALTIPALSRAGIAQLVERNLAKVEVGSSSLLSRSNFIELARVLPGRQPPGSPGGRAWTGPWRGNKAVM